MGADSAGAGVAAGSWATVEIWRVKVTQYDARIAKAQAAIPFIFKKLKRARVNVWR
jgi:hypothetical protein